jgi:predicted nucleic acid-binding protein
MGRSTNGARFRRSSTGDLLDVERYPHEPFLDRVWGLRNNVTAYDAVYVALAETLGELLVTGDRKLAGAPRLNVRVELV